jgi:hypothetical protein
LDSTDSASVVETDDYDIANGEVINMWFLLHPVKSVPVMVFKNALSYLVIHTCSRKAEAIAKGIANEP